MVQATMFRREIVRAREGLPRVLAPAPLRPLRWQHSSSIPSPRRHFESIESLEELRRRYLTLAKQSHPDMLGRDATAAEAEAARQRFVEIAAEYEEASTRLSRAEGPEHDGDVVVDGIMNDDDALATFLGVLKSADAEFADRLRHELAEAAKMAAQHGPPGLDKVRKFGSLPILDAPLFSASPPAPDTSRPTVVLTPSIPPATPSTVQGGDVGSSGSPWQAARVAGA